MFKKIASMILLLFLAPFLTGCMSYKTETYIEDQNTATITITFSLNKTVDQKAHEELNRKLNALLKEQNSKEYSYEIKDTEEKTHYTVQQHLSYNENGLINPEQANILAEISSPHVSTKNKTYQIQRINNTETEVTIDFSSFMMNDKINFLFENLTFEIGFSDEITSTNGYPAISVDKRTAVWKISDITELYEEEKTTVIKATGTTKSFTAEEIFNLTVFGTVIVLSSIFVVGYVMYYRKQPKTLTHSKKIDRITL